MIVVRTEREHEFEREHENESSDREGEPDMLKRWKTPRTVITSQRELQKQPLLCHSSSNQYLLSHITMLVGADTVTFPHNFGKLFLKNTQKLAAEY